MNAKVTLLLAAATIAYAALSSSACAKTITYVYDFGDELSAVTPLSNDGWAGDDIGNWQTNGFMGDIYSRNDNGGDDRIFRPNDGSFSYSIPTNTTFVSLEIIARSGTANFWQAGLAENGSTRLGIGGEFNVDDKYFILDQFNRIKESGTNSTGDLLNTLRLDLDIEGFTADLTLNDSTLLIDDAPLTTLDFNELTGSNELYVRTNSQFVGPARFTLTVTTVPEPQTFALAVLAALGVALCIRRRAAKSSG